MKRETHDELAKRMLDAGRQLPTFSALRHVKSGDLYRVHDTALDEATLEPVVIYAPEERPDVRFMRPLAAVLARFVRIDGTGSEGNASIGQTEAEIAAYKRGEPN